MQGLLLMCMGGSRALCSLMGVKSLQSLCTASGWVLKRTPGCSLLPVMFGRVLARGKSQAGIAGASGVHAADCHSCRHRQLGTERCPWGMGPDLHLLAVGHVWAEGTAEDRSRGLGGHPSAGKLRVRASPVHTGAVFLLGWCQLAPATIQHLVLEEGFFAQPGGCM